MIDWLEAESEDRLTAGLFFCEKVKFFGESV